jgi:hypothetical protein
MSVDWDLDDQRMLTRQDLVDLLGPKGAYSLKLRLRESNALELQQRLLSDMGRVGLVSKMPFTFPVQVLLFTVDADGALCPVDLPETTREGGVCITGRDGKGEDLTRLILTETSVDEVLSAILRIEEEKVSPRAREALKRLRASASFRSSLQAGLKAPAATAKGGLGLLKMPAANATPDGKPAEEVVGLIARNPSDLVKLNQNQLSNAAVVLVINDLEPLNLILSDGTAASGAVSAQEPPPSGR